MKSRGQGNIQVQVKSSFRMPAVYWTPTVDTEEKRVWLCQLVDLVSTEEVE